MLALAGAVAGLVVRAAGDGGIVRSAAERFRDSPRCRSIRAFLRSRSHLVAHAPSCSAWRRRCAPAAREPGDVLRDQTRSSTGGAVARATAVVARRVAGRARVRAGRGGRTAARELRRLRQVDLGVQPDDVLTFELHLAVGAIRFDRRARVYDDVRASLEAIPGVVAAGGVSKLPATGAYNQWGVRGADRSARGHAARRRRGAAARDLGRLFQGGRHSVARGTCVRRARRRRRAAPRRRQQVAGGATLSGRRCRSASASHRRSRKAEIIGVVSDVALDNEGTCADYVYHAHRQFAGDRNWALAQVVATTGPSRVDRARRPSRTRGARSAARDVPSRRRSTDAIGRGEAQRVFTLRLLASFALCRSGSRRSDCSACCRMA